MLQYLPRSECTYLHKTVNMVVFLVKSSGNIYLHKRDGTHANVQSLTWNEKREYNYNTDVDIILRCVCSMLYNTYNHNLLYGDVSVQHNA